MALMQADLTDIKTGGRNSARLRERCPQFAAALDDFYLMLTVPGAFDWHAQPAGWRWCQRVLSAEYRRIQSLQMAMNNELLQFLLKRGV